MPPGLPRRPNDHAVNRRRKPAPPSPLSAARLEVMRRAHTHGQNAVADGMTMHVSFTGRPIPRSSSYTARTRTFQRYPMVGLISSRNRRELAELSAGRGRLNRGQDVPTPLRAARSRLRRLPPDCESQTRQARRCPR